MKNIHAVFTLCVASCLVSALFADIPAGYYDSTQGHHGEALKERLHELIKGHQELSYADAYKALIVLDRDPTVPGKVVGLYSGFKMDGPAMYADGAGWNREHVWAKSFGDFGTTKGAGTDLHHLRAEDVSTNSARNNRSFTTGGDLYVDQSGTYHGSTPSRQGSGQWTWEPRDEVKGDVARMLFYMAVRYEGSDGEPDLELSETITPKSSKQPTIGVLSSLLAWHQQDPVDDAERKRNDLIFEQYQRNRNPFIDHPEFVARIWGAIDSPTLLAVSAAAAASETETSPTVEVGTYNLYWLGSEMRYGQGLRSEADVHRLADLVSEELDLEIVVFQEVNTLLNGESNGKQQTDREYKWLKNRLESRGYKLMAGTTGGAQRVVIAYDAQKVELLTPALELDVRTSFDLGGGCRSSGLRKPLAAQFRAGRFDFWVVGVHLKSQRGGDCSDEVRAAQTKDLLAAIGSLTAGTGENDLIILGDFNASARDNSISGFYYDGEFTTLTWPGRLSPESGENSYLPETFASIIDHVLVRTAHTTEYAPRTVTVYAPEQVETYIRQYSDHAPVWASFRTDLDDDH